MDRAISLPGDEALIQGLAESVSDFDRRDAPRPRWAGLIAELTGRPGRDVEGWLAFDPGGPLPCADPVGLVALVTAHATAVPRHSISWLLVHPAARRRGIGRRLVATACHRAWERSATMVQAECCTGWAAAAAFWRAEGFDERPLVCSEPAS